MAEDRYARLRRELEDWQIPDGALDDVLALSRKSLDEVKALTEYEDGKAARLLTVIAFLSAVVGAVFTRFASDFPFPGLADRAWTVDWVFPVATYGSFFAYVLLVTAATITAVHAIKPRFNTPRGWKASAPAGAPGSMVFYAKILDVDPPGWGRAFRDLVGEGGDARRLKARYVRDYVIESYLIAEKVATKLRQLRTGIVLLTVALCALLAFFCAYAVTLSSVRPTRGTETVHATPGPVR